MTQSKLSENYLNDQYGDKGISFEAEEVAKHFLAINNYKKIAGNYYRTKQNKEAWFYRLTDKKYYTDTLFEVITIGWLVTFGQE